MKKILIFSLLLNFSIFGFTSCSDDNDSTNNNENTNGVEEQQPQTLLTKMEASIVFNDGRGTDDNSKTEFVYNDKNKLVKMVTTQTYGNGSFYNSETKFYYDADKITGAFCTTIHNTGSEKDSSNVVLDSDNNIIKGTFFNDYNNFSSPSDVLEYKWSDGKLAEVKSVLDNTVYPITYTNGNITLLQHNSVTRDMTYTATFDDKKNPYSLLTYAIITYYDELDSFIRTPEDDQILAMLNTNNITKSILTISGSHNELTEKEYSFEYNEDGYPTKETLTRNWGTVTTIYTYEKK